MFLALRDAIDPTIAAISTIFIALSVVLALVALSLDARKGRSGNA